MIDKLYVNTNTNSLPDYTSFGEGNNPYASIAAAGSDEGPNHWYGWDGAKWNDLGGSPTPGNGDTCTNAVELMVKDGLLKIQYYVNDSEVGSALTHSSNTNGLPTLRKLGFSGYGDFQSFIGKGVAAFEITAMCDESTLRNLLGIGVGDKIDEALNDDWGNGLKAWQNIILGIEKTSADEGVRPYLAPVQNANPSSLSFTVGNCAPAPILAGVSAKFQVYEVSRTGEAVESGITSGEELIGDSASIDLDRVDNVKFFRIKIRFE